ncbi:MULTISPECIES: hypothetical protein [unclassified Streptomyces]|uniref:hypothetical protein n=1 Tax=unclassified Streptomyces TaxID=2593676 RepID=UPI0011A3D748|nr:hypothetical protein [Streptomyces sp. BK340]TVZ85852.1 hypothetical protein FB157_11810 [Streptomyces sp. BK340]
MQYISALADTASEDAKHVNLYVTVSLTGVLVTLTQIPFPRLLGLPLLLRITLILGVAIAMTGSALFFKYVQALHRTRMGIVRCLASGNAKHARELWAGETGVWKRRRQDYTWGMRLTVSGHALVAFVIAYLLLSGR